MGQYHSMGLWLDMAGIDVEFLESQSELSGGDYFLNSLNINAPPTTIQARLPNQAASGGNVPTFAPFRPNIKSG